MNDLEIIWSGEGPVQTKTLTMFPHKKDVLLAEPTSALPFLHDPAITAYKGTLFAAWYNCSKGEIIGSSIIRGRTSRDQGKTWSDIQIWAEAPEWFYVPPAFASLDEGLFLFVNRMTGPDQLYDLMVFRWNGNNFEVYNRIDLPFLVNCSAIRMINGKLICGGRRNRKPGEMPLIPAVLISDSGTIEGPWRIVDIYPTETLPDGGRFRYPETGLCVSGSDVVAFVRNDSGDKPILFRSCDSGEHWSQPVYHNMPIGQKKIAAGVLSDGRAYVIANPIDSNYIEKGKDWVSLFIALAKDIKSPFDKAWLIQRGKNEILPLGPTWIYPSAVEMDGKLFVAYTTDMKGAALSILPIDDITSHYTRNLK